MNRPQIDTGAVIAGKSASRALECHSGRVREDAVIENIPKNPQQDSYTALSASKSALMPLLALQREITRPIRKADTQRAVRLRLNRFSWSRMTSTAPPGIARFEGKLDHYSGD